MRYLAPILCLFVLCGGMFRKSPLDGQRVVQFHQAEHYEITVQGKFGGAEWVTFPDVEEGDCIAYLRGLNFRWRACFDPERCTEAVVSQTVTKGCARIFRLDGTQFVDVDVLAWNEANVEE